MKKLFVFLLLIAGITTSHAQKKMAKIDIPVEMVGVDATALLVMGDKALIQSQNKIDTYQVTHDNVLEVETQYFFILRVSPGCEKCEVRDAQIVQFIKSPRQIYRERQTLIKQYLIEKE